MNTVNCEPAPISAYIAVAVRAAEQLWLLVYGKTPDRPFSLIVSEAERAVAKELGEAVPSPGHSAQDVRC